jgi:hypothetical protein
MPPAPQPDVDPTWDDVLSAFTAQAEAAQALLTSGPNPVPVATGAVAFDGWQLSMPRMPDDVRDRALALHARQQELVEKLHAAMAAIRQQQNLLDAPATARGPVFVDQRA